MPAPCPHRRCLSMAVTGTVVYLPPLKCGSGDPEIETTTRPSPSSSSKNSQLTFVPGDMLEPLDVGSELKYLWA